MNVVIDAGNSFVKTGIFEDNRLTDTISFPSASIHSFYSILSSKQFESCIISSVIPIPQHIINYLEMKSSHLVFLDKNTRLPVRNGYKTPQTLGNDRIAMAVATQNRYPGKNALCISIGTCITYNFVSAKGIFLGGAISPGLHMRLRAMHEFTAGLPLFNLDDINPSIIDNTSTGNMASGIEFGVKFEIEGYIAAIRKKYKDCEVIICGGDSRYVAEKLEIQTDTEPDLVLAGLNIILNFNAPE